VFLEKKNYNILKIYLYFILYTQRNSIIDF